MPSNKVPEQRKLPVTLLSGFLGSGKTTLLKHILTSKHNLKCAVIVNDMAALNIDAEIVKKNSVLQREEKLVQMQNGCICCTLREDLLEEVSKLAKAGEFDYLVIESTGISEPMQVAETFTFELNSQDEASSITSLPVLADISRLDCCVTVIDASNFFSIFDEYRTIGEAYKESDESDNRTLTDLMIDQIEFSNVILINKIDLVSETEIDKLRAAISRLNPKAKVLTTIKANISLTEILNTGLFDFNEAVIAPGWLQSIREEKLPETLEYGVSSFVYRSRKPFHPKRISELFEKYFVVQETSYDEEIEDESEIEPEDEEEEKVDPKAMYNQRSTNRKTSPFAGVLRSKGFMWLASRPDLMGEYSQAGGYVTIGSSGYWLCVDPTVIEDEEVMNRVKQDFSGPHGDRRQEICIIGQNLDERAIIKELDDCLLDENEFKIYTNGEFDFEDNFELWPEMLEMIELEELE